MREKLTGLFDANGQAVLETLSARETVSRFQKALDEATADFAFVQNAQRKIAEERNLITSEIAKLSGLSR
jgi:DNA-binding phage protein